jgi:hypothetical protein
LSLSRTGGKLDFVDLGCAFISPLHASRHVARQSRR